MTISTRPGSKFISADGTTGWLLYSANFTNLPGGGWNTKWVANPEGSKYAMSLHEIALDVRR